MKIYTDAQFTEDLSKYTDEELAQCGVYNREYASKPIKLKNVDLCKNEKGQLTVRFETVNHKYLDVEYVEISSLRESDDGKNFPTHHLHLYSQSKYPFKDKKTGKKHFESPVSRKTISLKPDSEEESDLLHKINGVIATLATKWSYCLTIVPYADLECIGEKIISIDKPDDTQIYGDSIKSKILSQEGRENYDRIFAKNKIKNQIIDLGFDPDELVTMDGYDHCIVGIIERFDQPALICYDKEKVLLELQRDGMNEDEALEFFNFNQIGAWMGEYTPCFLTFFKK